MQNVYFGGAELTLIIHNSFNTVKVEQIIILTRTKSTIGSGSAVLTLIIHNSYNTVIVEKSLC